MNFTKDEIKNIIKLLKSDDKENQILAFSIMSQFTEKKNIGDLLIIYQFSKTNILDYKAKCKKCFNILCKILKIDKKQNIYYRLPSHKIFNILEENKCEENSIKLYLELLSYELSEHLHAMGYSTKSININIDYTPNNI